MKKLFYAALTVVFVALSTSAQTSADFRAKFGKPLESYEVRSNILMTVDYDTAGNVSVITLEAKHANRLSHPGDNVSSAFSAMPEAEVNALLAEILPAQVRGKRSQRVSFSSSCNGLYTEVFENLSIRKAGSCRPELGLYSVQVRWKKR